MESTIVVTSLGITSFVIAWQDFSSRTVHIAVLLSFLLLVIPFHFFVSPIDQTSILMNAGFLLVLFLTAGFFAKLVFKKSFRQSIGAGDIVYLIISAFYFHFVSFIVWFNLAILFTLLFHLLQIRVFKSKMERRDRIPLAGYLSIIFIVAIIYEQYIGSFSAIVPNP